MSYHLRHYENSKYWYARITRPDGSRNNWKSTRKTSKRDAERVAQQWDAAESSGTVVVTLAQALQLLSQHMERHGDKPSTMEVLRLKSSWLVGILGHARDIATIKLADTEAYLDERRKMGRKDATIAKELGYLVAALKRCFKLNLYHGNYESVWPDALAKQFAGKTRWITWDEYLRILEEIFPAWRDHLIVYVSTGVRFAELYTLHTRDIRNGILRVQGTKTDGAVREIPLSAEAAEVLKRRAQSSTNGVLFDLTSPDIKSQKRAWLRALASACRRLKIPHVSTNDCRRTFASWCWHRGIDKQMVIRWMGHSSEAMVDRVYQQPSMDHYREEIAKFPSRHLPPTVPPAPTTPAPSPWN